MPIEKKEQHKEDFLFFIPCMKSKRMNKYKNSPKELYTKIRMCQKKAKKKTHTQKKKHTHTQNFYCVWHALNNKNLTNKTQNKNNKIHKQKYAKKKEQNKEHFVHISSGKLLTFETTFEKS